MVESAKPLSSDVNGILEKYFSNYEYAVDINKGMRGETPARLQGSEACKIGEKISKAILECGFTSTGAEILYRSMDCMYVQPNSLGMAKNSPVGKDTRCLVTAASHAKCANFNGSKVTYVITMAAGEKYIRNRRSEFGVGDWTEYLLAPGSMVHYGDYDDLPLNAVPVMYTTKQPGEIDVKTIEGCLRKAGMKFPEAPVKAMLLLPNGTQIPAPDDFDIPGRYVNFPWGAERTRLDGTVFIFDIRRSHPGKKTPKKDPVRITSINGIPVHHF